MSGRAVIIPAPMSIDRGDSHHDDAKTWERACRHIGLFLHWAAARGLASDEHRAEAIAADPAAYVISELDTKLTDEDLNEAGNAFAEARYSTYLDEVSAYAARSGLGDYDIPQNEETQRHFFAWLDDALAAFQSPGSASPKRAPGFLGRLFGKR